MDAWPYACPPANDPKMHPLRAKTPMNRGENGLRKRAAPLRRQVESIAGRDELRVPVRELLGALDQYYRLSGDFEQAVLNLDVFAQAIQRGQAPGREIGTWAVQLRKFGVAASDALRDELAASIEAQKTGSF